MIWKWFSFAANRIGVNPFLFFVFGSHKKGSWGWVCMEEKIKNHLKHGVHTFEEVDCTEVV